MRDTIGAAKGRWPEILRAVGVEDVYLKNRNGPCPFCGGRDRFRFDDKDGSGSYFCSGCGPSYGLGYFCNHTGLSPKEAMAEIDSMIGNEEIPAARPANPGPDPAVRLRKIMKGASKDCTGTAVEKYLHLRGLKPSPETWSHPGIPYWEDGQKIGTFPCMLHVVRDSNGDAGTLHVTYLTPDGQKADVPCPKKMLPKVRDWVGGAVMLEDVGTSDTLAIAEGIETALAVSKSVDYPVWATTNAHGMEHFEPSEYLENLQRIVIYADNDSSYTGQAAAYSAAKRLKRKGYVVEVRVPGITDTDWADIF